MLFFDLTEMFLHLQECQADELSSIEVIAHIRAIQFLEVKRVILK